MLRLEYLPLDSLTPAKRNAKRHHADIATSLTRFGLAEVAGIVDERTGRLLGGHGRVEALRALKARGAPLPAGVEDRGGAWYVPVLLGWSSTGDEEAEAALLALNSLTTAGGWNPLELNETLKAIGEDRAQGLGFDKGLLESVFGKGEAGDDDAGEPEPSAEVWVQEGTLFALGSHRLFVGDSLTVDGRARLFGAERFADCILTDPPYAIFGSSSGIGSDIADDKMVIPFFEAFFKACAERLKWAGHLYTFTDWRSWAALWNAVKRVDVIKPKNGLVWTKNGSGLGSNYAMTNEWCLFAHKLEVDKSMSSGSKGIRPVLRPNVFTYNRPSGEERLHNAAKPVAMLEEMIANSTDAGELVWDPFCGSGSTMIAAENIGRRCYLGEVTPKNAQIAIERWQRKTGRTAEIID